MQGKGKGKRRQRCMSKNIKTPTTHFHEVARHLLSTSKQIFEDAGTSDCLPNFTMMNQHYTGFVFVESIPTILATYRLLTQISAITLLPNFHLWIIHMVGYHCSSLRKRTKVTKHTNDEYELFTRGHTSKCVVTFVLRYAAAS